MPFSRGVPRKQPGLDRGDFARTLARDVRRFFPAPRIATTAHFDQPLILEVNTAAPAARLSFRGELVLAFVSKWLCVSGGRWTRTPHPYTRGGFFCIHRPLRSRAEPNPSAKPAARAVRLRGNALPLNAHLTLRPYKKKHFRNGKTTTLSTKTGANT